jgi:bacillithiol system protein YtxJ
MSILKELTRVEQWDQLVSPSQSKPLCIFKHSTSCPVSAEAFEQFQSYLTHANPKYDYAMVKVIESRPVSNQIAEHLQVKHQSPQVIVVKDGEAVWHDSHWRITEEKLIEILG